MARRSFSREFKLEAVRLVNAFSTAFGSRLIARTIALAGWRDPVPIV